MRGQRLGGGGVTRRGVRKEALEVFTWPRCPYCQSANVAAVGEYVCRDCGTVLGPVLLPPVPENTPPALLRHTAARYRLVMLALEREDKKSVKRKYG